MEEERKQRRVGDLQLEILKVLWEMDSASVAEVHERLAQSDLAYTTIATMLRKMEARGLVQHRNEGRRFIYVAAVREDEITRSMAGDLVDRFEGSLADLVSHLLDSRDVTNDELSELERLIAARKKRR